MQNAEIWKSHFRQMAQGKIAPNHSGVFIVNKSTNHDELGGKVNVNVVSPTQQTVEQAKAIIKPKSKNRSIRGTYDRPPGTLW